MSLLGKLLFILLAFALPLSEVIRVTSNEISVTLIDIAVGVTVLYWIIINRNFSSNLSKPILIFIGVLFLSLIVNLTRLNSEEILISFLYLLRWIFYASIFFVVKNSTLIKSKVELGLIVGGVITVLFGFMQYFLYPDLRNLSYAGWDNHLYRMFTWTFFDPNFAGIFFVLFFLFILNKIMNKDSLIFKIFAVASFIAIILTFSRSAYIALIFGLITLMFIKGKKLAGVGLVSLFIILTLIFVQVSLRSEGTNLLRTASGEARLDSINNALTIFKQNPIFGVGFNSYRYAQRDYGFIDENKMLIHSAAGTDNSFLFVLATSGVVGFAGFTYLILRLFSFKDAFIKASLVALVINSLFINSLFYPSLMLWLWVILGLRENT